MQFKNIIHKRFGRLLVISFIEKKHLHTYWNCLCDCGNKTVVTNNNLQTGHTKSCGCFRKENSKRQAIKHGFRKTKFYFIYHSIKLRCNNPNDNSYGRYGGRGIKCLWQSFEQFRDDMYKSYQSHITKYGEKNTTIDRIDNNGNYCKENCRWATRIEQARNRRDNHFLTFNGKTMTIAEWSIKTGIRARLINQRINRDKWSPKDALSIRL